MVNYKILQLNKENRDYLFRPYEEVENDFDLNRYNMVYEGQIDTLETKVDTIDILDHLYRRFNTIKPTDFKGHSLSVSDIVVIDGTYYYCDSFGWQKLNLAR